MYADDYHYFREEFTSAVSIPDEVVELEEVFKEDHSLTPESQRRKYVLNFYNYYFIYNSQHNSNFHQLYCFISPLLPHTCTL